MPEGEKILKEHICAVAVGNGAACAEAEKTRELGCSETARKGVYMNGRVSLEKGIKRGYSDRIDRRSLADSSVGKKPLAHLRKALFARLCRLSYATCAEEEHDSPAALADIVKRGGLLLVDKTHILVTEAHSDAVFDLGKLTVKLCTHLLAEAVGSKKPLDLSRYALSCRLVKRHLLAGQGLKRGYTALGALGYGIEIGHSVHLVAKELDSYGHIALSAPEVDNAASPCQLAAILDCIERLEAHIAKAARKLIGRDLVPDLDR